MANVFTLPALSDSALSPAGPPSETAPIPLNALWGKQGDDGRSYPLAAHLQDTQHVAVGLFRTYMSGSQRRFLSRACGSAEAAEWLVATAAALHDLGKASPCFQFSPNVTPPDGVTPPAGPEYVAHHTILGAAALLSAIDQFGPWTEPLSLVLLGHHGDYAGKAYRDRSALTTHMTAHTGAATDAQNGDEHWREARAALVAALTATVPPAGNRELLLMPEVVHLVTGLIIAADWVASSDEFLQQRTPAVHRNPAPATVEALVPWLADTAPGCAAVAESVIATFQLAGTPVPGVDAWGADFATCFGFAPRGVQKVIADAVTAIPDARHGALVMVTAPTGEGKTETALWCAHEMARTSGAVGITFALPTMATTDAMFPRLRDHIEAIPDGAARPVSLVHGMAGLNDTYTRPGHDSLTAVSSWMRGSRKGMLAHSSVCTIDQILMMALAARFGALRALGLTNRVLIIDEAHAYDAAMQLLLQRALSWLGAYGVPVILLSATLNKDLAHQLLRAYQRGCDTALGRPVTATGTLPNPQYPGVITYEAASGQYRTLAAPTTRTRTLRVHTHPLPPARSYATSHDDVAGAVVPLLAPVVTSGGVAAVIVNTVATAQAVYDQVRATTPAHVPVVLLHARMPWRDRQARTQTVLQQLGRTPPAPGRPPAFILIATQIAEQSLDIDVDLLITQLPPMAMLLQRAGRLWRHDGLPRPAWATEPVVHVLTPTDVDGAPSKASVLPYSPDLVAATRDALHAHLAASSDLVRVPDDVQPLVDRVYTIDWATAGTGTDPAAVNLALTRWLADKTRGDADQRVMSLAAVPWPDHMTLTSQRLLTRPEDPETELRTRLGADRALLLPVVIGADGVPRMDPLGAQQPLPTAGAGGWLASADRRAVLDQVIPVSQPWLIAALSTHPDWARDTYLGGVLLLPVDVTGRYDCPVDGRADGRAVNIDTQRGLLL